MPTPFSIIIPTRCRPQAIKRTLLQLSKLNYPNDSFEVIIVENSPEDTQTKEVVHQTCRKMSNFRYFSTDKRGASVGRNKGVSEAKYNHLIFVDDDVLVSTEFLNGYASAWKKYPNAGILGGRTLAIKEKDQPFSSIETQLLQSHDWCFGQCDWGVEDKTLKIGEMIFSANLSLQRMETPKTTFSDRVFDERLGTPFYLDQWLRGEDLELCTRYLLDSKEVIFISDDRLTVKNIVSENRFTETYILDRYFLAGIELAIVEIILQQKHPELRSLFYQVAEPTNTLRQRIQFILDKYKRRLLFTFFLSKRCFAAIV